LECVAGRKGMDLASLDNKDHISRIVEDPFIKWEER
jgi:hypothetical protein